MLEDSEIEDIGKINPDFNPDDMSFPESSSEFKTIRYKQENVHDFVFDKMINWEQGDWYALLEPDGKIIWDYMGSSWKIFYHTVRSTCLTVKKLKKIVDL